MNDILNALIVDDEEPARKRLIRLLKQLLDITIVGEATNGLEALEKIAGLKPDIVFLDIEMPELDGIAVANSILPNGPAVIFVTAYDEYAIKAFEVAAVDYLVKPIIHARLEVAVKRVQTSQGISNNQLTHLLKKTACINRKLAVRSGSKFIVFDPSQVSAIVAQDHYSTFLMEGRELISEESLDKLILKLPSDHFIRVHRNAIINIDHLKELKREGDRQYIAILSDAKKTHLSVSKIRLTELKNKLGIS